MKTTTLIFALLITMLSQANDNKYDEQMARQIDAVYKARTLEEYQTAVNAFDRIAAAEKTKWEPYYYSAFGNIMKVNLEQEATNKDNYLDQALAAIEKGKAIAPAESELVALEGFVHMMRVTIDPASRGQQYSGLAMQTFGKAIAMNPDNPRALALLAQMQFGTARFFNQAPTEACASAQKALTLFETVPPVENKFAPGWGKQMAQALVNACKQ
jgi:hypothetical protein